MSALDEIRGRWEAATPGPWGWFGNTDTKNIHLATPDRGRQFIMTFRRWGMQGAQPWFNTDMLMKPASEQVRYAVAPAAESRDDPKVYRADISGINHPDATAIAHAPEDVARLLAAVEAVESRLAHWEERFTGMAPDEVAMRAAIYLIRKDITAALEATK